MIRLSVLYPATPNSKFDWDYYLGPHLVLAEKLLRPHGLIKIEVDRGIGAFPPGAAFPFHAVGHLLFPSQEALEAAMAATAPALIEDQMKYYDGQSVVQVNSVERVIIANGS